MVYTRYSIVKFATVSGKIHLWERILVRTSPDGQNSQSGSRHQMYWTIKPWIYAEAQSSNSLNSVEFVSSTTQPDNPTILIPLLFPSFPFNLSHWGSFSNRAQFFPLRCNNSQSQRQWWDRVRDHPSSDGPRCWEWIQSQPHQRPSLCHPPAPRCSVASFVQACNFCSLDGAGFLNGFVCRFVSADSRARQGGDGCKEIASSTAVAFASHSPRRLLDQPAAPILPIGIRTAMKPARAPAASPSVLHCTALHTICTYWQH